MSVIRKLGLVLLVLTLGAPAGIVAAQPTIPPGTVITKQNWQQYRDFFSKGVQTFWEGNGFWKMPDDVEIHVAPTKVYPLPQPFIEANEKYGAQTRLVKQSDGRWRLKNYISGLPFPNPSGPNKALEIATDVTYRVQGYVYAGFPNSGSSAPFYTKDRFGNWSAEMVDYLYRQLAYNWNPAVPRVDPLAGGAWYTEWLMVETPEQSRYTADLTIFFQDNLRDEADYVFIPALRRSLQLSTTARCAPLLGSDMTHDDQRVGWNGGVGRFDADFLREQKLLSLVQMTPAVGKFPAEYDGQLGWAKPSWGPWELRNVWVINVHRIPSMAAGYCYGRRIMYIDKSTYQTLAEDLYDTNNKLWKVVWMGLMPGQFDSYGTQSFGGGIIEVYWDVQNNHVSYVTSVNPDGRSWSVDSAVAAEFNNVTKYSTPGGLMQVMR
jgi:hypothetical protein